jgi:hypothetical protein
LPGSWKRYPDEPTGFVIPGKTRFFFGQGPDSFDQLPPEKDVEFDRPDRQESLWMRSIWRLINKAKKQHMVWGLQRGGTWYDSGAASFMISLKQLSEQAVVPYDFVKRYLPYLEEIGCLKESDGEYWVTNSWRTRPWKLGKGLYQREDKWLQYLEEEVWHAAERGAFKIPGIANLKHT